jgi:hypothetical protein
LIDPSVYKRTKIVYLTMATCSSAVYPPAVIASVQQQVREATVHADHDGAAAGIGSGSNSGDDANDSGGEHGDAMCLPEAWRPKPCLLDSEFRDSIVREARRLVLMCPCCYVVRPEVRRSAY